MRSRSALEESRRFGVRAMSPLRPLHWLALGWRDFRAVPLPGLLHGTLVAMFGALLLVLARNQFWWLAGAFTGFLLVSPILATGLYAISRARELGESAGMRTALRAWRPRQTKGRLVVFGILLAVSGTGWVVTSASLITVFSGAQVRNPADFIRLVVLAEHSMLFEAWLALGGVLAAPVFASSVIALPLLMDRDVSLLAAVLTSWRVVMDNPLPMAVWAALLMLLTGAGMLCAMLGLVFVLPLLAHASWHAYRDLINVGGAIEQR